MKLVHAKLARSIWLFDLRDMNPEGKDVLGDLVSWIREAYHFAVAPDSDNPTPNAAPPATTAAPRAEGIPGLTFRSGSFQAEEEIFIAINNLTIYDDGIVVDAASSTEDADRFAQDLLSTAAREFALTYDADTIRKRLYLSELIVKSDIALESLNPLLGEFAGKISNSSPASCPPFSLGGLSFWSDADGGGKHKMVRFERQSGRAFSESRYFSDAPFQTGIHIALLEQWERMVMDR